MSVVQVALSQRYKKQFRELMKEFAENPHMDAKFKKQYAMDQIVKEMKDDIWWFDFTNDVWKENSKTLQSKSNDKIKNFWMFDIRPSDELGVERFKQFTFELFKKKIFKSYYYVFEQAGTDEKTLGKGVHFHSIVEFNSPCKGKAYFLNEIFAFIAKKNYQNFIISNVVEIKKIDTQEYLNNRLKYINTSQFGKGKDEKYDKWVWDKEFRKKFDIKDYYISDGNSLSTQDG